MTPRTALVILDHVTSATAFVLPVAEITDALEPDIAVLIDGAHAPGMVDVDIAAIGASFYTANCHKWICAPKGAAFLWVDGSHRSSTTAAVISHGYNGGWPQSGSHFHAQFDWTGTDDPTARLSVDTALQVMDSHHPDGWPGIRASNHALVLEGCDLITTALEVTRPVPDPMLGSIAAFDIPASLASDMHALDLVEWLHNQWAIEVPISPWPRPDGRVMRISAQQYNQRTDYERLATALLTLR